MRLKQVALLGALLTLGTLTASLRALPQQDANAGSVTFNKQVLPILQKNCQSCHRPGEIAPMSFLTYQEVRPWAKGIKAPRTPTTGPRLGLQWPSRPSSPSAGQ